MPHQAKLILQELKTAVTTVELNGKSRSNLQQTLEKLNSQIEFLEDHLKNSFRYERQVFTVADCYRRAVVEYLGSENHELADAAEKLITRDYAHIGKMFSEANRFIDLVDKNSSTEALDLESGERVGEYKLQEIRSKSLLAKMGQTFKNCLTDSEQLDEYYGKMQRKQLEIWMVERNNKPFCLISVNTYLREVEEVEFTENNDGFRFPYALAMELLNELDANADRHAEFAKIGAFRAFVNSDSSIEPKVVEVGDKLIWIWNFRDEIIIAMKDRHQIGDNLYWSRFFRSREPRRHRWLSGSAGEWQVNEESHINFSDLLNLVIQYPILAKRLNELVLGDIG